MKKTLKRTGYIVSHTHWDREWRYPIWETRLMLVEFMDELIEMLESGKYPGFLLDGQVIPVLDYLEVRPEMTERVKTLIAAGKLEVGPWLLLPDEYPVDGEALVRNLLWGNRRAKELGGVFNIGYTSFGWGQTAQLPQLYAGFGIDVAMIGKYVSEHRAPQSEFVWQSPDGSEVLATRFGQMGRRQNFYFMIHLTALFGVKFGSSNWKYEWAKGGIGYHRADRKKMEQDHFRLDAPDCWYPEMITAGLAEETWQSTDESEIENHRLMMDGCDYAASQLLLPEMLKQINEMDTAQDRQWVHTTMSEFAEVMTREIDRSRLTVVKGELRDGPVGLVTGNALTTRLYLKRLNKKAQNLLIRFAEPMTALVSMAGGEYYGRLVEMAWKSLMEAHPHDSINGVTQDKTANDVQSRLLEAINISEAVGDKSLQELVRRINMKGFADTDILLVVFNPLPYSRREVLESWINVPLPEVEEGQFKIVSGLQIFDADGNAVSTQWQGFTKKAYPVAELHTRPFPYDSQRHKIFFDSGMIPAGGYKIFRVGSWKEGRLGTVEWSDSKARTSTILKTPNILENEFLRVEMNCNSTFNLTDKELNNTFFNLNYYEDRGEIGNYWVNGRPMYDQIHTSLGSQARIWAEETGPLQATLVSEITMRLPVCGMEKENRRSDKLDDFCIRTAVTLRAGQHQVEINVDFENRHEDHYLRAMLPTGLSNAVCADAGGHFTVDQRPIRPQGPTAESIWPDMATLPQNNFVDISDDNIGLAILNDSLTEYEVFDNRERTIALSLLRAVKNSICTGSPWSEYPSQKGGQCIGRHSIRYAIMPHKGNWKDANVPLAAELFNVAAIPVQTRKHEGELPAGEASLFEIDNTALRFSTIKKTEDRDTFIVRIYNPTNEPQAGSLRFLAVLSNAWLTNLNEEREKKIPLKNKNEIPVVAGPQKIVTVEFETK